VLDGRCVTASAVNPGHRKMKMTASTTSHNKNDVITILGFGSLLSERSSRTTFPDLQNFRLGRVPNYRRVFGHPASIFFQRGIANLETKEISSLSAEPCPGHAGFVCSVFDVPSIGTDIMEHGVPSQAFLEREEEFNIVTGVIFESLDDPTIKGMGTLCTSSDDETYISKWGKEHFDRQYRQHGINTIWGWERDSGLRPCAVYLRHCYLAAQSMGDQCFNSFLDETYLVDRETKLRDYMNDNPQVLEATPTPDLVGKYSG
jgi:hypothetical protein